MLDRAIFCDQALCSINLAMWLIKQNSIAVGAHWSVVLLLLTQRYVALTALTSWIIGHQGRYRSWYVCMCSYECVLSSQESPCAFFFHTSTTTGVCFTLCQRPLSTLYVYASVHMCICSTVCTCISFYLCTHQSVSVCHTLHLPSPVALCAVLSACPPWPHAAIYFFRLLIQRSLSQPITVSRAPWPLTPPSLSACYMPNTELRPSDPDCLFIFPPTVSDHIHSLRSCPPYSTLPVCSWVCWNEFGRYGLAI